MLLELFEIISDLFTLVVNVCVCVSVCVCIYIYISGTLYVTAYIPVKYLFIVQYTELLEGQNHLSYFSCRPQKRKVSSKVSGFHCVECRLWCHRLWHHVVW